MIPRLKIKTISLLAIAILLYCPISALAKPQMEMHRVQATTQDPSGWYLAESTNGLFSVLVPIPFNDFTIISEDPQIGKTTTHTVGGQSAEGVKFSATKSPVIQGRSPASLEDLPQQFERTGGTVTEIDSSLYAGYPSISFSVRGPQTGAYMRYVTTPTHVYVVTMEYPLDSSKKAENLKSFFLSSLKLETSPNP